MSWTPVTPALSIATRADGEVAVVALRGALSLEGAARTLSACRAAAVSARQLEVSLAEVRLYDVTAIRALIFATSRWCEARGVALTITVRPGMLVTGSLQSRGRSETRSRETAVFP